jgi:hypothetical protein
VGSLRHPWAQQYKFVRHQSHLKASAVIEQIHDDTRARKRHESLMTPYGSIMDQKLLCKVFHFPTLATLPVA